MRLLEVVFSNKPHPSPKQIRGWGKLYRPGVFFQKIGYRWASVGSKGTPEYLQIVKKTPEWVPNIVKCKQEKIFGLRSLSGSFIRNTGGCSRLPRVVFLIENRPRTIPRLNSNAIRYRRLFKIFKMTPECIPKSAKMIPVKIPEIGKNPTWRSGTYVPTPTIEEPPGSESDLFNVYVLE